MTLQTRGAWENGRYHNNKYQAVSEKKNEQCKIVVLFQFSQINWWCTPNIMEAINFSLR